MKNIMLYGGAFDPPHLGHAYAVKSGMEQARKLLPGDEVIDEVWILPDDVKFFNEDRQLAPFTDRVAMLRSTMDDGGINNYQIKYHTQNKFLPKGMFHILKRITLEDIRSECNWFFLMGQDQSRSFDKWIEHDRYKELPITFIIVKRTALSSSSIRNSLLCGHPFPKGLTPWVNKYIRKHNLYTYGKETGFPPRLIEGAI